MPKQVELIKMILLQNILKTTSNSLISLLQEAFHGFDLLEVTGHVSGQDHLHHQSPQLPEDIMDNAMAGQTRACCYCTVWAVMLA